MIPSPLSFHPAPAQKEKIEQPSCFLQEYHLLHSSFWDLVSGFAWEVPSLHSGGALCHDGPGEKNAQTFSLKPVLQRQQKRAFLMPFAAGMLSWCLDYFQLPK